MTAVAAAWRARRAAWRRVRTAHPEWWAYALAAAAGAVLLAGAVAGAVAGDPGAALAGHHGGAHAAGGAADHAGHAGHADHARANADHAGANADHAGHGTEHAGQTEHAGHGTEQAGHRAGAAGPGGGDAGGNGAVAAAVGAGGGWMLMAVAMMVPVAAPHARRVGLRSLWPRRHRAVAAFLAAFVAVWAAFGLVTAVPLAASGLHPPPVAVAVALVLAAAWQVAPPRRRALRRCESPRPAPVHRRAADRACLAAGARAGRRCAFTCGPVMVAMALGHGAWLMAGLTAVVLSERRRGPNPERRAGRPHEAVALLALAAAALAVPAVA